MKRFVSLHIDFCKYGVVCVAIDGTNNHRVDVFATEEEGLTPLHDAAWNNRAEVCRLLLQQGGRKLLAAKTCLNYTALDLATDEATLEVLCAFLPVNRRLSDSQGSFSSSQGMNMQQPIKNVFNFNECSVEMIIMNRT